MGRTQMKVIDKNNINELINLLKKDNYRTTGSAPGTIRRFKVKSSRLHSEFFKFSSHLFSIPQAIYLSASLGKLPENMVILGVEAKSFDLGNCLSSEAEKAVNNIEKAVQKEIMELQKNKNKELEGEYTNG
jgi:hydrogenase maturation protease